MLLSSQTQNSLSWWLTTPALTVKKSFLITWNFITTNASFSGWRGVFSCLAVEETKLLINILDLRAVMLALQHSIPNQGAVRQCNNSGLHQPSGCLERSKSDHLVDLCGPHLKSGQLESGLFQPPLPWSRGVDPLSSCLQSGMLKIRDSGCGHLRQQTTSGCCQNQGPSSFKWFDNLLVSVQANLGLPSSANPTLLKYIERKKWF